MQTSTEVFDLWSLGLSIVANLKVLEVSFSAIVGTSEIFKLTGLENVTGLPALAVNLNVQNFARDVDGYLSRHDLVC